MLYPPLLDHISILFPSISLLNTAKKEGSCVYMNLYLGKLWYCVNHMHRRTEPIMISALPLNHPPKFWRKILALTQVKFGCRDTVEDL